MDTIEPGIFNNVFIGEQGQIVKITRHAFPDLDAANNFCDRLEEYHAAVSAGPLAVAELLSVDILAASDGYRVQHEMPYIPGPSFAQMPFDQRRGRVREVAHTVAEMPLLPGSDSRILTPVDLKGRNLRMRAGRAVLTDDCPPFFWDADGFVSAGLGAAPSEDSRVQITRRFGEISGVMADLLAGVAPPASDKSAGSAHLTQIVERIPEWYADLLPSSASPELLAGIAEKLREYLGAQLDTVLQVETQVAAVTKLLRESGLDPQAD